MKVKLFVIAYAVIGAVAITAFVAASPSSESASIVGKYGCTGQGPDGKPYQVDLEVEKRNDAYGLTWSTSEGTTGVGVGLVKGNVLSVIFQTAQAVGVAGYSISKNSLDGTWTVPQLDGMLMPEKCSIGSGPTKAA